MLLSAVNPKNLLLAAAAGATEAEMASEIARRMLMAGGESPAALRAHTDAVLESTIAIRRAGSGLPRISMPGSAPQRSMARSR